MIYISISILLLSILINISIEESVYDDFPYNKEFNIINEEKENNITIIFDGNILTYFRIKNNGTSLIKNVNDCNFDFINRIFKYQDNEIKFCNKCSKSESDYSICINSCLEEYSISYGEHIYLRYIYIPFLLVFFGSFICLYGRTHYIFKIFVEFIWFIYFLVIDSIQLFKTFNNGVIPFYVMGASFISGFMIAIFGNMKEKHSLIIIIFNIITGVLIGFYFIKTLFYYISIFAPINSILYIIFVFLFMIFGGVGEYFVSLKYPIDNLLYIISSAISGSLFIVRGISYIVGGYFSESLTSNHKLKYNKDAKLRVTFFLVLHVIILICSLIIQIIDSKKNNFEDELLNGQNNEKNTKINEDMKEMNKTGDDLGINQIIITQRESLPEHSNTMSDLNSNQVDEDIDDQED